jgi:hypothetical protein
MYLILFCHQGSSGINSSKEIMLNSISLPAGTKDLIDFLMQIISSELAENRSDLWRLPSFKGTFY